YQSPTSSGWCVSCASATTSAIVSCSWWVHSAAFASQATSPVRGPRYCRIAATCATTTLPLASTGGANGGCTASGASSSACTAPSPPSSSSLPTSTYAAPASSSARRTNSPRPWIPGQ